MTQASNPQNKEVDPDLFARVSHEVMFGWYVPVEVDMHTYATTQQLLGLHIMEHVLSGLGFTTQITVRDADIYDDGSKEDEGSFRIFALKVEDEVYDLKGNRGWPKVLEEGVNAHSAFRGRNWIMNEWIDEKFAIEDEISLCRYDLKQISSRAGGEILAKFEAERLESETPIPMLSGSRPRF